MVNQWVQFVRQFAKDNNISYGCAISEQVQHTEIRKEEAIQEEKGYKWKVWRWKMLMLLKNK